METKAGSKISRSAIKFFTEMNGAVGRHLEVGVGLARAEQEAEDRGWRVTWEGDDDPDLSWCECSEPGGPHHEHEVLCATLKDADGEWLGSLAGITDPDRNYGRLVEAELASEALAEIATREENDRKASSYLAL